MATDHEVTNLHKFNPDRKRMKQSDIIKLKFIFDCWLPNKKNGNPTFWAISILPEIQFQYSHDGISLHIGWLFWTFSIEYLKP